MAKFENIIKKAKETLQTLLTAENTESVTGLVNDLDSLSAEYKNRGDKLGELQETLVNYVRNTAFSEPSGDDDDGPKTIDDILSESLEKVLQNQKK